LSNIDSYHKISHINNFFEDLYRGFNIKSVQASRMLNANPEKRGKLSELLISNYEA